MSKSYNDCLSTRIRHGNATPKEEALADAAPALLEACRAVQRDIDGFIMGEWESSEDGWKALSDRLYAAIAQAEGGGE